MSERTTRVRRSAVGGNLHALLNSAHVGDRLDVTLYGASSRVVITELTPDWVEVRTVEDEQRPAVSDLASWLLERIAEDEAAARECAKVYPPPWEISDRGWTAYVMADAPNFHHVADLDQKQAPDAAWLGDALAHIARWDPARVLAECEAKRRIVADVYPDLEKDNDALNYEFGATSADPEDVLRLLALPYASHDGYREEWRP